MPRYFRATALSKGNRFVALRQYSTVSTDEDVTLNASSLQ
jgi:hypothetical protein